MSKRRELFALFMAAFESQREIRDHMRKADTSAYIQACWSGIDAILDALMEPGEGARRIAEHIEDIDFPEASPHPKIWQAILRHIKEGGDD